jgi:membrane protein
VTPRHVRHPTLTWPFVERIAERSVREFFAHQCPHLAASISFRVLFALFPLAIVAAAGFGLVVHTAGVQSDVIDAIVNNVPLSASGKDQLRDLLRGATGGASALGFFAIVGLLWAASGLMAAIRVALNRAWDVSDPRPPLQGKGLDLLLVFAASLLFVLSFGLTVATRFVERYATSVVDALGIGRGVSAAMFGIAVPFVLAFSATLFLYWVVPAGKVFLRDLLPAALLVALVWAVLQIAFAIYLEHFGRYNAVYGSLGAIVAFLVFVYVSSNVFLLGAEVASKWPRVAAYVRLGRHLEEDNPPLRFRVWGILKEIAVRTRQ